jgi:hypothetical protein
MKNNLIINTKLVEKKYNHLKLTPISDNRNLHFTYRYIYTNFISRIRVKDQFIKIEKYFFILN